MSSSSGAKAEQRHKRGLVHQLVLLAGVVLLVLLAIAAVRIGPLLLAPNHYAGTPSIERTGVYRDPVLMRRAWALPVARAYAAGGFEFQHNPSFCGTTSVANVLRSLGRPAGQKQVIDGTRYEPWFGVLIGGLTLDELAELLALRLGRPVRTVRSPSPALFRALLRRSNNPGVRIIANFHRGPLFGRGHGHLSPILGYLEREDLVLIGDVNADYRPFLVKSARLLEAINTIDDVTGRRRGLILASGLRPPL
jgi:hypothetical protein